MKFTADKRGATRPLRRKAMMVGVAALAAAAFAATPVAAEPAAAPTTVAAGLCTTGTVQSNVDTNVYSGWNSYRIIGYTTANHNYSCNGSHTGRSYTACEGGNTWLLVHAPNPTNTGMVWGYSAAKCFSNQ
jgi:hypothetical protein